MPHHQSDLGSDVLIGAREIAEVMNWRSRNGNGWDTRRVYHLADTGSFPIHRVKGLGICARRSSLKAFFEKLDQEVLGDVGE